MKTTIRMFLIDVVLAMAAIGLFLIFKLTGIVPVAITLVIIVAIHVVLSSYFTKKEFIENELRRPVLKEELKKLREDFPEFEDILESVKQYVYRFGKIKESILTLIELNQGEKKNYLTERNEEAEDSFIKKIKQLRKDLVVLNALDQEDDQYKETINHVNKIRNSIKELVKTYADLLSEVNRMGDEFEVDDPKLRETVDRLKRIRTETDDSEEEEGLFVVTGDDF